MSTFIPYERQKALTYAKRWAYDRNPAYYDFHNLGGDCTNFISQCLYAGCGIMNYKPTFGWYYISLARRSPAWSAAQYLHTFLINNQGTGPYGAEVALEDVQLGDIIQLGDEKDHYYHSLLVTALGEPPSRQNIRITTHTYDAADRPFSSYVSPTYRCIHILGARG